MKEVFRRIFGYFGRDKQSNQGPSVLGMETKYHRHVPDPEEIKKAVHEAKEMFHREENDLKTERLD